MPSTMRAIKSQSAKKASIVSDLPLPSLPDDYILVKVSAVGLNPTDWKHIDFMPNENATVGCDYAGTVVEIGSAVTKPFKKGDRITGMCHGVNALQTEDGAFGEYARAKGDIQIKIPDNVSDEEAATLGVGISTVGQGLYQSLGLPTPDNPSKDKTPVLIYGGSTSTGMFAIQYAKLSGLTVVTTCSPRNFEHVKSLGADAAFDYADPRCGAKIREYTHDGLRHAFDCISEGSSPQICADALTSRPGEAAYSALLPNKFPRDDVEAKYTLAYTTNGKAMRFRGNDMPAKPEDFEFARGFWGMSEGLLAEGKVRLMPTVREGGLEGVFGGLEELRSGKVSAKKLVYKI